MASLSGNRLGSNRYIRHPAAATTYWPNGAALDAGMAMVIDSNLSWLVEQSCRHLVADVGYQYEIPTYDALTESWDGLEGEAAPTTTDETNELSWINTNSRRYGPFVFVADKTTPGGVTLRDVKVLIDYYLDLNYLYLWAALSLAPHGEPPDIVRPIVYDKITASGSGSSQNQETITLSCTTPVNAYAQSTAIQTRSASTNASATAHVLMGYLWVGYASVPQNPLFPPANHLWAVSAWETR